MQTTSSGGPAPGRGAERRSSPFAFACRGVVRRSPAAVCACRRPRPGAPRVAAAPCRQLVADADDQRLREAQRRDQRAERLARVVAELEADVGARGFSGDSALSVMATTETPRARQRRAVSITSGV